MAAEPTESNDNIYPLLPLRDVVVYPHMVVPLFVGREKSITALEDAMENDKQVVLLAQRNPRTQRSLFSGHPCNYSANA
jgi:ATP-dependent Lon protease